MKRLLTICVAAAMVILAAGNVWAGIGDINIQMVDIGTGSPFDGASGEHIKLWGWSVSVGGWVIMDKDIDADGWAGWTAAEIAAEAGAGPFHYNVSCYADGGAFSKVILDGGFWGQFIDYDPTIEKTYIVKTPPSINANQQVIWNGPNSEVTFDIDLGDYDDSDPDWDWDFCHFETSQTIPCAPSQGDKPIMQKSWLDERGYTYDDGGAAVGDWCYLTIEKASEGYSETFGANKTGTDNWTVYLAQQQQQDTAKANGSYNKDDNKYTLTFDPTNVFDPGNTWTPSPSMVDGETYYVVLRINLLNTPESGLSTTVSPGSHYGVFHPVKGPIENANTGNRYYSIQPAIDAANLGDTIIVADGTYTITAAINVNKGVTITGNVVNPENVLVKYGSSVTDKNCFDITANNVMVQGVKAINGMRGFYLNGVTGCKVSNCIVSSCADKGIYVRQCAATSEAERVEVTSNVISDCGNTWYAACIQTYGSPYTYIYNNTINATEDKGINIIRSGATGETDRVQVIGNTISETKWPGIQVIGSPYTYVYNNTLTRCNYWGADGTGDWDYASIHVQDDIGPTYSHYTVINNNTVSDGINGIQVWSSYCTITNNTITDMGLTYADEKVVGTRTYKNSGILVGSNWGSGDIDPTGTVIQCNNICDNYWGLFYSANLTNGVTAELNWWGDNSGPYNPTTNPGGLGDAVSDNVDYDLWTLHLTCSGFEPPMDKGAVKVKKNRRVLPLKAELLDGAGNPVTGADITALPVIQVIFQPEIGYAEEVTDDALFAGEGTEGNQFVFSDDKWWQFNLKIKNYTSPGTYTVTMVSGDECEYVIESTCTASFVVQ